ncbi:MAG TPA: SCO family protein [Rhodanobacteraceae bacterium]|nr:SCO family protein [Rhodanobacteraceae bacterium]
MSLSALAAHRSFVWIILAAALAAGGGLWLGNRQFSHSERPGLASAVPYPQPRALPDFQLVQANGKPLTLADWKGRWNVAYFGYVSCPDVCPTTLAVLKQVWKSLEERGLRDRVRISFVSIDPQRDTPEMLGKYVAFFSPDFLAATGSDEQLTRLTRALGLLYSRTTGANGEIQVDHSGSAVIVDPQGRLVGMFRPPFAAADVAADLATLAATGN